MAIKLMDTVPKSIRLLNSMGNRVLSIQFYFFDSALFDRCEYHGCCKCRPNRDKKVLGSYLTYEEAYQKTIDRSMRLRKYVNLIEIWECDYRRYAIPTCLPLQVHNQIKFFIGN